MNVTREFILREDYMYIFAPVEIKHILIATIVKLLQRVFFKKLTVGIKNTPTASTCKTLYK